jgi:Na+/H+ antiporter NhaD/arsenite permease-like protein
MIWAIVIAFIVGYLFIVTEHFNKINKAATALVTGVVCWIIYIYCEGDKSLVSGQLTAHLGDLSGILFFLMGAMAIVELIDAHNGFEIIKSLIAQTDKRKLLWIISFITFFLSALLDNLTSTIVMISILRKLVHDKEERLFFSSMIVIASNAGGVWSPIGDVTTTMLWIGGQITTANIILHLFLPGFVCLITPLVFLSFKLKGKIKPAELVEETLPETLSKKHQYIVFFSGALIILLVPVFKMVTHLPPYMGMLLGLGLLWVITEILHGDKDELDKERFSVGYALRKIDTPSILFFLGILLSIAALEVTGVLSQLATVMNSYIANLKIIGLLMGALSSVIDNVPLIAATQGMYPLSQYPTDHYLWEFLAYTTGTGGSLLIIGSAAGVAAMGMEKINFFWYLKRISWLALIGFLAGAFTYILQEIILQG